MGLHTCIIGCCTHPCGSSHGPAAEPPSLRVAKLLILVKSVSLSLESLLRDSQARLRQPWSPSARWTLLDCSAVTRDSCHRSSGGVIETLRAAPTVTAVGTVTTLAGAARQDGRIDQSRHSRRLFPVIDSCAPRSRYSCSRRDDRSSRQLEAQRVGQPVPEATSRSASFTV